MGNKSRAVLMASYARCRSYPPSTSHPAQIGDGSMCRVLAARGEEGSPIKGRGGGGGYGTM